MSAAEEINTAMKQIDPEVNVEDVERVLSLLNEVFETFHLGIGQKMESVSSELQPDEGHVLDLFYEDGMSHDVIADQMGITVRQVYDLRRSGLEKLAEHIGRSTSETVALLHLHKNIHDVCSPEAIEQIRHPK